MSVIRHPNTAGATLTQWRYTATGGETSLSGTDGFSTALSYTVGSEQVFINGVLLERGVDYAATTGTTITGLTALVANDIATVISPSSFNVANAIPKSTVTAKGDLLAATGASTVTNLPVGADGTTLVANSFAATGMSWTGNQAAGKNGVINGGMDIWQRGTSFTSPNNTYTADRWSALIGGSVPTTTISRQTTSDTTNLPNIQYCARVQRNSGQTNTGPLYFTQSFENVNSTPFIGKTVTLSFYARAGANYSASGSLLNAVVNFGTGTDQNINSGFTGSTSVINSTPALTTTWQRFSYSGTVGATATQLGMYFQFTATGTAGAADYFEITGVQLELGAAPTTFTRAGGTLQGELAACQRYYFRSTFATTGDFCYIGTGTNVNTVVIPCPTPVTMRTTPSAVDYSNLRVYDGTNAATTVSAVTLNATAGNPPSIVATSTGVTAYRPMMLLANTLPSYIGFSAEL